MSNYLPAVGDHLLVWVRRAEPRRWWQWIPRVRLHCWEVIVRDYSFGPLAGCSRAVAEQVATGEIVYLEACDGCLAPSRTAWLEQVQGVPAEWAAVWTD